MYERVVSLKPKNSSQGNVLLSYILEPFLLKSDEPVPNTHNYYLRSLQMAKTFLDLGYSVDVIDYRNMTFIPEKEYVVFIDVRHNLERLAPMLNPECIKIFYIDTAHILYHSAAGLQRLLFLQQRKKVTLRPRRLEIPNLAIEYADCAITHGNEFTISTFSYAKKPIYKISQSHNVAYPYLEDKNYEVCRESFLWFGSGGLIHKGLDLVLDAFMEMPNYHLYICGPIEQEKDFEKAYYKELYETPNIHTVGWVDITSPQFTEITSKCLGLVYPSCSEGGAGSVIQCMHAGLIPIVSYESGVDVYDFGIILKDCSIDSIKNSCQLISLLSVEELRRMARGAWEYATKNHTKERFTEGFRNIIETIINTKGKDRVSG
jgi:glycosyltransferase involved in cell wall biosynthesis